MTVTRHRPGRGTFRRHRCNSVVRESGECGHGRTCSVWKLGRREFDRLNTFRKAKLGFRTLRCSRPVVACKLLIQILRGRKSSGNGDKKVTEGEPFTLGGTETVVAKELLKTVHDFASRIFIVGHSFESCLDVERFDALGGRMRRVGVQVESGRNLQPPVATRQQTHGNAIAAESSIDVLAMNTHGPAVALDVNDGAFSTVANMNCSEINGATFLSFWRLFTRQPVDAVNIAIGVKLFVKQW